MKEHEIMKALEFFIEFGNTDSRYAALRLTIMLNNFYDKAYNHGYKDAVEIETPK